MERGIVSFASDKAPCDDQRGLCDGLMIAFAVSVWCPHGFIIAPDHARHVLFGGQVRAFQNEPERRRPMGAMGPFGFGQARRRKFLADAPLDLRFAKNGAEAQELTKRFRPQVILMDMSMPEVNGLDATRAIRNFDISQPYIAALTANVDDVSRRACIDAGMDTFLSKPLSRQELLNLLVTFAKTARMPVRS